MRKRGIGNGRVIPAGPLRAPLDAQLDRAEALVVVGEGDAVPVLDDARKRALPVFRARLAPDASFIASLAGKRVLAFAGIGDPEKFFATLREAGVTVAATRSFDDHHRYTRADAQALCGEAERAGLFLVTTEKDFARMQRRRRCRSSSLRASRALPVTLTFDDEAGFQQLCCGSGSRSALGLIGEVPLQHDLGRDIGFLQVDAPVFQLFERDRRAGDGAAHEGAGPQHAEIPVEVFDLGLAGHR